MLYYIGIVIKLTKALVLPFLPGGGVDRNQGRDRSRLRLGARTKAGGSWTRPKMLLKIKKKISILGLDAAWLRSSECTPHSTWPGINKIISGVRIPIMDFGRDEQNHDVSWNQQIRELRSYPQGSPHRLSSRWQGQHLLLDGPRGAGIAAAGRRRRPCAKARKPDVSPPETRVLCSIPDRGIPQADK